MEEKKLEKISKKIRKDIIEMIYNAKSGHPGGSLSCADILVALYHGCMDLTLDEKNKRRDKFILSKGHAAPAYYAVLSSKGFIPHKDLNTLRKVDSYLEGHPSNKIPGIDVSSGSLGQGLSIANGMALSRKIDGTEGYVYCLMGDGEIEEGQIWEALMTARKYELNNIIAFIDRNSLQIDGDVFSIKNMDNIVQRFEAFGWNVQEIDGHDFSQIINSVKKSKESNSPNIIIANTVKGKGVSFMENKIEWHGKSLNDDEYMQAIEELSE